MASSSSNSVKVSQDDASKASSSAPSDDSRSLADHNLAKLFKQLCGSSTSIEISSLKNRLKKMGIHKTKMKQFFKQLDPKATGKIGWEQLLYVKEFDSDSYWKILQGEVTVKDWPTFISHIKDIYAEVLKNKSGENAQYIPQLAQVDPDQFGVSVCTVDGQFFCHGDTDVPFSIQSCSKPVTYCIASEELGDEKIKQHVGHEPSGKAFNAFALDRNSLPHNPMINAGAIMAASLVKADNEQAERFGHVLDTWSRLAASRVGFDNPTYLSELRHADNNFALAYFMKSKGAFPSTVSSAHDVQRNLELYFQFCSILASCEQMSVVAATLANGGVNPLTLERIFKPETVRNCLSLMFSCGMYDYSGEFAYSVGLPAKSGVAGCVITVVPGSFGFATWSPRLDPQGNSSRGVDFFTRLVQRFPFHFSDPASEDSDSIYRTILSSKYRENIRLISEFIHAASVGNLQRLRQLAISGCPLNVGDYDSRTALHVAAAEGHAHVVKWLIKCGAPADALDRWGHTPLRDAQVAKHQEIVEILEQALSEND